jgi:hypothetical protein
MQADSELKRKGATMRKKEPANQSTNQGCIWGGARSVKV